MIMENITFIPEKFNAVELGFYKNSMNSCTPGYPDDRMCVNTIIINIPQKVVVNVKADSLSPIIPICAVYSISAKRSLKYNALSAETLHIRKNDDEVVVYTGEIKEPYIPHKIIPTWNRDENREERVLEAQKYSDEELDEGQASGGYMNLNIMEYVDMPFAPGRYEVWLSFYGLESNHCFTEIIAE
jgi:hypothetical protein